MNIVVEKQPKCIATLQVRIPSEKVTSERAQIVHTYTAKARIPGFRPGKAPAAVVEKRYAKDISEELQANLINEAYDEALKQESLKVLDFGIPTNVAMNPDGSFSFDAALTLAPEVTVPEYKGITVTVPSSDVPEEELTAQLESLRERFADFNDITGRAADIGDFAVIDYSSTVEGQPTEEFLGKPAGYLAGRDGFWVRLDDKFFLPGFASQVVGMNPGDSREITVTLPEDFPVAELATRELKFATTLKELKQSVLPELNDELAARLSPGKSMAELTDIIRQNMGYERQRKIDDMKVNQIVAQLTSQADFELPEDLVTGETQTQADAMVERGVQSGMTEEEIQTQQAEIFAAAGYQAATNLRTNFILQEIARTENIEVEDKELVSHLIQIANSRKVAPKKFIKDMQREGRITSIRQSMVIGKTIDFLLEHADVQVSPDATLND